MLEDFYQRQPVASWNTVRGVWETNQVNLLCGHLEPFLETWQSLGMMRNGRVYALPMQTHPTTGLESSLLRTPVADETGGGPVSPAMAKAKGQTLRLTGQIIDLVEPGRLPTPTSRDHKDGTIAPAKHRPKDKDTLTRAMDHKGSEWGQYEPAIRRWEQVIGREAPKPTEPTGRDGQQQLSAKFTEWMMGLDDGWITSPEIGLTRNEALRCCGNGVVPQQAVLALTNLLKGVEL